jgi:hypothetical protein
MGRHVDEVEPMGRNFTVAFYEGDIRSEFGEQLE